MHKGHKRGPQRRGVLPTRAQVKAAVEVACMITGAHPTVLLSRCGPPRRAHKDPDWLKVVHARVYALFALRAIFEDGQVSVMAEMLGAPTPKQYSNQMDMQLANGRLRWWSDAAFMRVVEATEHFMHLERKESEKARKSIELIKNSVALNAEDAG